MARGQAESHRAVSNPPASHRDYAAIVFFANSRFETGKKKLQYLSFRDFAACAQHLIQHWTLGAVGEPGARPSSTQLQPSAPPEPAAVLC